MEENKTFIDIRQNISTTKNNNFNVASPYYDENIKVINKYNDPCLIKDLYSDNFYSFNFNKAKRKYIFEQILLDFIVVIISVGTTILRNFFTVKFIGFETNFLKYLIYELSIILLYITFFSYLAKEICFRKYNFAERQTILYALTSSKHFPYVKNETAINDVFSIVNFSFSHYFGENKKMGRNYLSKLRETIKQRTKRGFRYDAFESYQSYIGKIEGKYSFTLALFSLVFGIGIQIAQIISVWQDVASFKIKILITSIFLLPITFAITLNIIERRYKRIWYELEADYLIFNYQNRQMPFADSTPCTKLMLPIEAKDPIFREEIIKKLVEELNKQLILEFVTFRSFEFVDDSTLLVYGVKGNSFMNIASDFKTFFEQKCSNLFK